MENLKEEIESSINIEDVQKLSECQETPQEKFFRDFNRVSFMSSGIGKVVLEMNILLIQDLKNPDQKKSFPGKVLTEKIFDIMTDYILSASNVIECRNAVNLESTYTCVVSLRSQSDAIICFLTSLTKLGMFSKDSLETFKKLAKNVNDQSEKLYLSLKSEISSMLDA